MAYTLSRRPQHTVEISGTLTPDEVGSHQRHVLADFKRRAQIPGFRPGKAPESAIRARFADQIRDELTEHLADIVWREVVTAEADLQPLTRPQVERAELAPDGGFELSATLEVRPRFELPDVGEVTLPEVDVEPDAEEVEAELDKLREENASWEPVPEDTVAEDGILVEADLDGHIEGSDDDPYSEEGARFVLGVEGVPDEVSEALQGARPGDERTARRTLPDDPEHPERSGKEVTYRIAVKALKAKVLPEADDGLAATVGLETLEELRERIADILRDRKRAQRREDWRRAVLDHLEQKADANDMPSSLVQSAVREDLNRFAYSLAMRGVSPESDEINWQEMAARFEPAARQRVLDTLVLEQLAAEWEVPVPESEVDAYILGEASQMGVPPAEHKANLAKENRLAQIRHGARISATVDELIRRAGGEVE